MSAVVVHPVLAELEQRAGASDKDRAVWLAERMGGVTATEIGKLYAAQGGARQALARELIQQKLGVREDTFNGNAYTAWGNTREPVIAQAVQERYAIAPESRVFHAADNPRFLASPDGVGVGFDGGLQIAEIKTAGKDMSIGSPAYKRSVYPFQKTWGMRVTGARRCLYAWEARLAGVPEHDESQFVAGSLHFEWFEYDEVLAAELEKVAVWFLGELDAARAALDVGEGPVVDEELDTLAVNLLRFRDEESQGKKAKEKAWAELQSALAERGGDFSQESTLARITYTAAVDGTADEVDQDAAVAADPKLWASVERAEKALQKKRELWREHAAAFTRSVPSTKKAGLTVTSVKPPKEKSSRG